MDRSHHGQLNVTKPTIVKDEGTERGSAALPLNEPKFLDLCGKACASNPAVVAALIGVGAALGFDIDGGELHITAAEFVRKSDG